MPTLSFTDVPLRWKTEEDQRVGMAQIEEGMEKMVRNILTVVGITALVNGHPSIQPKDVEGAQTYFHKKCPLPFVQSGGGVFPASYFGGQETMYAATNAYTGTSETIDFAAGTARGAIDTHTIGGQMSGGSRPAKHSALNKWIQSALKTAAEEKKVAISKMATTQLVTLIKRYAVCLWSDLAKKPPLTVSKVGTVLRKRTYQIFH